MSFLYPIGLLGLIGIPVIILIYILKNRYTEQTVSSTYIWTISERFLKNKKPISKLKGLISLILQCLAVLVVSLAIAHPVLTLKNAAKEYCFILDGSGSMAMTSSDSSKTRFELGKEKIHNIINDSKDGSKYTLIFVSDNTRVVYERLSNREHANSMLDNLDLSYLVSNCISSIGYAQEYYNDNRSVETYLITDRAYDVTNLNLINVSSEQDNYAITNARYIIEGGKIRVYCKALSYEKDATLNISLKVDGEKVDIFKLAITEEDVEKAVSNLQVVKNEELDFTIEIDEREFNSLEVICDNKDALEIDNKIALYNVSSEHNYSTLIVSNSPYFLKSAISTVANSNIKVIATKDYQGTETGYSLYVFDSYAPAELPRDGSIWLFNTSTNIPDSGFTVQDKIDLGKNEPIELTYQKSNSSAYRSFTKDLSYNKIYLQQYVKYGLYKTFTTVLAYEGNPMVFAGSTNYGNREVVFAFDLHDSNMPLLMDYLILTKNFVNYSFPTIIEESSFTCGDVLSVNVLSNCKSIELVSPSGTSTFLDVQSSITDMVLTEVGTYKLNVTIGDEVKEFNVYSKLPMAEGRVFEEGGTYALIGEKESNFLDGRYDKLLFIFILIGVIFVADWMVYCYEQYQLQ